MSAEEVRAAVVLAGGRARRLGGTDKPRLEVGGRSLLATSVGAVRAAGCSPIVVVGPRGDGVDDVVWVREDPPYGGPAAGVAAALGSIEAPWMLLLAADLPHADAVVSTLIASSRARDGVRLDDADGRPQWLAGLYRTAALRTQAGTVGAGASMRALLSTLTVRAVRAEPGVTADVDTWEDLYAARRAALNDRSSP